MMEDLSLHILDIAENAAAAGATRVSIAVLEDSARDILSFRIRDNGRGMSPEERRRALDPFFSTKGKRTGLGLPLLAQTASLCDGRVLIRPVRPKGTSVEVLFRLSHVDRPPLTKMAETLMAFLFGHPGIELRYRHTRDGRSFSFRRGRPRGRSVQDPLRPDEIQAVREALRKGLAAIGVS